MKRLAACISILVLLLSGCGTAAPEIEGTHINLSDSKITVDGREITNDSAQAVYSARDIVFYLAGQDFTYGEGTAEDEHEQSEADAHTVVHITKPGRYVLSGKLSLGQIAVDLGEDSEADPNAVVTLILNGVDITCEIAPAVIFYNVYECSSGDADTATKDVDTSAAGANVIIADDTVNNVSGSYVAKIYKSFELNEEGTEVVDSKKLHKYDGALYSRKTMNIDGGEKGSGILNITAENEGLNSELHLTVNGGIINITSGNDGINTNEDYVSVTTVNGGALNIFCNGGTGEGDGIDSNGWLVINGGSVTAQACAVSGDAGIDSDMGIYINGGSVVATGNMLDRIAGGDGTYAVFSFAGRQSGGNTYTLKNSDGESVFEYTPANDFIYLIISNDDLIPGDYTLWQGDTQFSANSMGGGPGGMMDGRPGKFDENRDGQGTPPEIPGGAEMPEHPDGERPQMPEGGFPEGEIPEREFPEGERPEKPEGENLHGGMMGGSLMQGGEISTVFTVTKGGNTFANVAPAA